MGNTNSYSTKNDRKRSANFRPVTIFDDPPVEELSKITQSGQAWMPRSTSPPLIPPLDTPVRESKKEKSSNGVKRFCGSVSQMGKKSRKSGRRSRSKRLEISAPIIDPKTPMPNNRAPRLPASITFEYASPLPPTSPAAAASNSRLMHTTPRVNSLLAYPNSHCDTDAMLSNRTSPIPEDSVFEISRTSTSMYEPRSDVAGKDATSTHSEPRILPRVKRCQSSAFATFPHTLAPQRRQKSVDASAVVMEAVPISSVLLMPRDRPFPFLPDRSAYLLSEEQHRSVEQSLCATKLLLHRIKRLLIENSENVQPFAESNRNSLYSPVREMPSGCTTPGDAFDSETFVPKGSCKNQEVPSPPEPTNLPDALEEIQRLRADNARLRQEVMKRELFIMRFIDAKGGGYQVAL